MTRNATEEEIKQLVREVQPALSQCNWDHLGFRREKAAFGAILSQIAYCATTMKEVDAATRAKLVPSALFQQIVATGAVYDVRALSVLAEAPIEIVQTATLVAVIYTQADRVFIGIRGTQFMYEWNIDAQAGHWRLRDEDRHAYVHAGFYKDARILSARLHRHLLAQHGSATIHVAVFGHSLGGAVAAVLNMTGLSEVGHSPPPSSQCAHRSLLHLRRAADDQRAPGR